MCLKGQLGEESPSAKLFAAAMEDSSVEAVWKMYSAARASLPYKERMDNLTWRMLGMRLRRRQQEQVAVKVERDVEMEYGFEEPFGSSTEGVEVYDLRPSVNPLNTVLMNAPEFQESSGPHQFGSFSNHVQSAGFLSSVDVHNQFNLFDATFSDQMNDQLTMDFSKSSPAIVSETSDSNARDRMSMMASDVLAGQSAGSLFRDSTAVTPTFPDQSNFLDHFFPSSIIGDAGNSAHVPPTPTATAKPKKLRQNSTATQVRRGSGVKKRPVPLRNPSTTSLTSLGNDPATASASQESSKDSSKDTRCSNCHTKTTPLWRRDPAGNPLCNACGLFLKLHGVVRPLSLKTDVIKKRQRNNNTSKQSKSSSPNLEDPKQTRKTLTSLGARKRSSANVRETSSSSPVTLASSLSRVNSNLEASEPSRRPATAAATHINDTHNFDDNNNTDTNNDDNNANNGHFDFFPPADLSLTDDTEASSQLNDTGIAGGGERSRRADKTPPQQKGANGNTNWEWLSLSL